MNVVFFASDSKGLSSLRSSIQEANGRGFETLEISSNTTQLNQNYQVTHKGKSKLSFPCQSLGFNLPFKPDWLIVNRERWNPESSIIKDFKKTFNCKVALIEPNAWALANCESMLECHSRNRFIDLIDVFFCHSTHSKKLQKSLGFNGNLFITGNPKYDSNLKVSKDDLNRIKLKYDINNDKENVLLFSLVSSGRLKINNIFEKIVQDKSKNYFYKPYPGEPFDPLFIKNFNPFFLENCKPILEENEIWPFFHLCNTHIGGFSSIMHASLLLSKKIINLWSKCQQDPDDIFGVDNVFGNHQGIEARPRMWMDVLGFKSKKDFHSFVTNYPMKQINKLNEKVINAFSCNKTLLNIFDDFNDSNACYRIINYLENDF